jgi:hypothetical protein
MANTTIDRTPATDEMPVALTLLLVVLAMALSGGVLLMVVNGLQQA